MAHTGEPYISYQALTDLLDLGYNMSIEYDRARIGEDLGEVSTYEHNQGRPLLSALVLHKQTKYQGDGFFKLCEELELGAGRSWEKLKKDKEFEKKCREDNFEFWKDKSNYQNYKDD